MFHLDFLKKKINLIIILISFFLFFYVFYKSEFYHNGLKTDYYKTYYYITIILIIFSCIAIFLNQKTREYLFIISASIIIACYLSECYLVFKNQYPDKDQIKSNKQFIKEKLYEDQTNQKWDNRTHFEIYKDSKENNKNISILVAPSNYLKRQTDLFPLSGISNVKTIDCNENGYWSIYKSDRYGFNNPNYEWEKKEIEFLLIGDSLPHGACVNRPNDIGSVLRNLSNKSVLNLGMGGNGPLLEFATLKEYLAPNVKKVLWFYSEKNDLTNLSNELKNNILINYYNNLNFSQNLKFKQDEIDNLAIKLIDERVKAIELLGNNKNYNIKKKKIYNKESLKFNFELIKFLKLYNLRALLIKKKSQTQSLEFKKIIQLTKNIVNTNNSELYFIYLPEYARYKLNYDDPDYNFIKKTITELNIPFIDINREVFKKEKNPLKLFPYELNGHYNVEGYKKVAEIIFQFTKN